MKKKLALILAAAMAAGSMLMAGCGSKDGEASASGGNITVISREDGPGTRGAFDRL